MQSECLSVLSPESRSNCSVGLGWVWFGLVLIVWQIVCFLISSSISICFLLEVSSSR